MGHYANEFMLQSINIYICRNVYNTIHVHSCMQFMFRNLRIAMKYSMCI